MTKNKVWVPPPADRLWWRTCSGTRRRSDQTGCCLWWSLAWSRKSAMSRRCVHCVWFYPRMAPTLPGSSWAGNSRVTTGEETCRHSTQLSYEDTLLQTEHPANSVPSYFFNPPCLSQWIQPPPASAPSPGTGWCFSGPAWRRGWWRRGWGHRSGVRLLCSPVWSSQTAHRCPAREFRMWWNCSDKLSANEWVPTKAQTVH